MEPPPSLPAAGSIDGELDAAIARLRAAVAGAPHAGGSWRAQDESMGANETDSEDGRVGARDGLIPAPPRNSISIGPLKFHAYGFALAGGALVGGHVMTQALARAGVATGRLPMVLVPAAIAAIVGARLYHVATDWELYRDDPARILDIANGGLGIYGAVAAGTLVGAFMARRAGIQVPILLDAAALALPIAQAIGRGGNYMNQELFGAPTDLPWGLQVDPEHRPAEYRDRNSFHPTFLYEAAWNIALAGGLYGLSKVWASRPAGALFLTYVAGYGVGRFLVEGLRIDHSKTAGGLRTNQWVSAGLTAAAGLGVAALVLARRGR